MLQRLGTAFATTLGLVNLLRELGVACLGNEIVQIWGLGLWFLAAGLGLAWKRGTGPGDSRAGLWLAAVLPLSLVMARGMGPLLGMPPGSDPVLGSVLMGTVLVLGPSGWLAGLALRPDRDPIAVATGAAGGGLAAGLLPVVPGLLIASLVLVACSGMLAPRRRFEAGWTAAVLLVATLLVATGLAGPLDRALTRWNHPNLQLTSETPQGRLIVSRTDDRIAVHRDGALLATSEPAGERHELVALAVTQFEPLETVLVLGGWLEGLTATVAQHGSPAVVNVEPDLQILRLAAPRQAGAREPIDVVQAEPHTWLQDTGERFDLILSVLPPPVTAQAGRFWTSAFFRLCAQRLGPGGVLALQLSDGQQMWSVREARRVAAVHHALQESFSDVQVLPGPGTILLAANHPLERDPAVLTARLDHSGTPAALQRWSADRTRQAAGLLAAAVVPANTDLRPVSLADNLLFLPGLGWRELPRPSRWLAPAVIGGVLLVVWLRRRTGAAATIVAGHAGLAAMILTSVILLGHQTRQASLFGDLGPLLAAFLLGQAAGLHLGRRPASRTVGRWRLPILHILLSVWSFLVTLGLLLGSSQTAAYLWLAGTGLWTALISVTVARTGSITLHRQLTAGLTGAGLGALLVAALLAPFSGLPAAALTAVALSFPAALAVWPLPGGMLEPPA